MSNSPPRPARLLDRLTGALKALLAATSPAAPTPPVETRSPLEALGAAVLSEALIGSSPEPTVLAVLDVAQETAVELFCVAFGVTTPVDARVQLRDRDGSVIDEIVVAPGRTDTVLFAPRTRAVLVARTLEGRMAKGAAVEDVRLYGFSEGAAAPDRVAVVGDLKKRFDWSEAYLPPRPGDLAGRLRARMFKDLPAAAPVPMVGGASILLEPGDELSRALFITGYYEPETMAAIGALLPKGGVFVDVGAHCGVMSLYAAKCVGPTGRVVAFEPSAREYERLVANVALNGLDNVILSTAAVADVAGRASLLVAEAGHAGHNTTSKRFAYPAVKVAEIADVETVTLDAVFAREDLKRCDVIKMDIEGGELPALKGALEILTTHRPKLILETFDRAMDANETSVDALRTWLEGHGYELRDIDLNTGAILPTWTDQPGVSKNVVAMPKGSRP